MSDELKEIRNSSSASFAAYADYVEQCRVWGRQQKAALGLATDTSTHLRALTRRQFKLVLMQNNLLDAIESAIESIEDAALKAVIKIEYNEATEFVRRSRSVNFMSAMIGLTDEQLDAMWSQALML